MINNQVPNIRVFDNGGETFDRYTVIINTSVYGMSINANSPQGFNQYSGELDELIAVEDAINGKPHNMGKEIPILDLPLIVRLAIGERLKNS